MSSSSANRPLVYACSGCSSTAQMANAVAVRLGRTGLAEMSCIAGVGGDVPGLVRIAQSGRPIVALDGCRLACVHASLARHGIAPKWHFVLTDHGVRKVANEDFAPAEAEEMFDLIARTLNIAD